MNKNLPLTVLVLALLMSTTIGTHFIEPAAANFVPIPLEHITIQPDGTISPSTAPVTRVGLDTYVLKNTISDFIFEINRDNAVVDGAGYTLQRVNEWAEGGTGVVLQGRNNVTIKNLEIRGFNYGIRVSNSSHCTVNGNKLENNGYGIWISNHSAYNVVSENAIAKTWDIHYDIPAEYWHANYALSIHNSSFNTLRNNQMNNSNSRNFWLDSQSFSSLQEFSNDVDASNTVDGKPIVYWINQHDKTVPADAGYVALVSCRNITAANLTLACNGQGVLLAFTTDSTVMGNNLWNNTYGVELRESSNNNISQNNIERDDYGIVAYSSGNQFRSNHIAAVNVQDANFESGNLDDFDGSNTIDGTPAYCWVNQQGKTVPSDAGFVALVNCDDIIIRDLNVSGKKQGMLLISTNNSTITNSTITLNEVGVYLKNSQNNQIAGNKIVNSSENGIYLTNSNGNKIIQNTIISYRTYGIYAEDSSSNVLIQNSIANNHAGIFLNRSSTNVMSQNEIRNNSWVGINLENCQSNKVVENTIIENAEWGIILKSAKDNSVYHNNFINNSWRAFSSGFEVYNPWPCEPNVWDNGTTGNYWSNYQTRYPNATEIGTSGVGDTAYFINVNNTDHYPLMKPVAIILSPEPSLPSPTPLPSPSSSPTLQPSLSAPSATLLETPTPLHSPEIRETVITAEAAYTLAGIVVAILIGAAGALFLKKRK